MQVMIYLFDSITELYCPTFWKTQSEWKVLEMSRVMSSRPSSLSASDTPSAGKRLQVSHPTSRHFKKLK